MKHRPILRLYSDYTDRWNTFRSPTIRIWDGEDVSSLGIQSDKLLRDLFPLEWRDSPSTIDGDDVDAYLERINSFLSKVLRCRYKEVTRRRDSEFRTFKLVHIESDNARPSSSSNRPAVAR
jgi:hypothetical protein